MQHTHLFPLTLVSRNIWLAIAVTLIVAASADGPCLSVVSRCRQRMDSQASAHSGMGN